MPEYRRHRVPGATYFFTLALANRRGDLLVREIAALRAAIVRTRLFYRFQIDAWVVLPEHMQSVWTLPDGDAGYSLRWTLIKRWFSAAIPAGESRSESRVAKGERGIWQRRFWEHTLRDPDDFARHVDYVHFNPVKHGPSRGGIIRRIGLGRMMLLAGLARWRVTETGEISMSKPLRATSDRGSPGQARKRHESDCFLFTKRTAYLISL